EDERHRRALNEQFGLQNNANANTSRPQQQNPSSFSGLKKGFLGGEKKGAAAQAKPAAAPAAAPAPAPAAPSKNKKQTNGSGQPQEAKVSAPPPPPIIQKQLIKPTLDSLVSLAEKLPVLLGSLENAKPSKRYTLEYLEQGIVYALAKIEHKQNQIKEEEKEKEQKMCCICWDAPRTVLLMPCKHLALCNDCEKEISRKSSNQKCPLCNTTFVKAFANIKL
ncbi:unnamed protein product, partial [Heterosigma akashiwo]